MRAVAIIGGGAAGTQCALLLRRAGVDLILVGRGGHMGGAEPDGGSAASRIHAGNRAEVARLGLPVLDATVETVEWTPGRYYRLAAGGMVISAHAVVLATGWNGPGSPPDVRSLDLEADASGRLVTDGRGLTSNIRLYAAGNAVSDLAQGLSSALGSGSKVARSILASRL